MIKNSWEYSTMSIRKGNYFINWFVILLVKIIFMIRRTIVIAQKLWGSKRKMELQAIESVAAIEVCPTIFELNSRPLIVRSITASKSGWTVISRKEPSQCSNILDLVMAFGPRPCSRSYTSSIYRRADLLDTRFHKSYGLGRLPTTANYGSSDVRLMHLCLRMIAGSSSHSHGSVSSSATDLRKLRILALGSGD